MKTETRYKILFLIGAAIFCALLVLLFTSCEKEESSYRCTLDQVIESNPPACGYPFSTRVTLFLSGGPQEIKRFERERTFTNSVGNLTIISTCNCKENE